VCVSSPAGTRLASFVFVPSRFVSLSGSSVVRESCRREVALAGLSAGLAAVAPGVDRRDAVASLADATRSWKVVGGRETVLAVGEMGAASASSSLTDESVKLAAAATFDLRPSLPVERKLTVTSPASCVHSAV